MQQTCSLPTAEKYLGCSVVVVMFIILQCITNACFMNLLKNKYLSGYTIYKTFMAVQSVAWKVILI
jgi:hypothetical protein